ncbi:MAG: hypothetical protein GEV08_21915 [Acidimicrobiia bacterium]|nr:hypothetical protein [Acidimicrobiia bacterium]
MGGLPDGWVARWAYHPRRFLHRGGARSFAVRLAGATPRPAHRYFRRALEELALPGFGFDLEQQVASMELLAGLERAGATLWFGHDADQWDTVAV